MKNRPMTVSDRGREVVEATLEPLRHTVGRDEHMPELKRLLESKVGPVTFAKRAAWRRPSVLSLTEKGLQGRSRGRAHPFRKPLSVAEHLSRTRQ